MGQAGEMLRKRDQIAQNSMVPKQQEHFQHEELFLAPESENAYTMKIILCYIRKLFSIFKSKSEFIMTFENNKKKVENAENS